MARQTPPFQFDPWLASSLLQKAIRRGETELAEQAATSLLRLRGSAMWRRFIVIAVEDVGIAAPDAVSEVVAICSDREYRGLRGDEEAARYLARRLAAVPKDRSADLLMSAFRHHPALEQTRKAVEALAPNERRTWPADPSRSLYERSAAAWPANGLRYVGDELSLLLTGFADLGVSQGLIESVARAESRTREPFCLLLPLLWLTAMPETSVEAAADFFPPSRTVGGVPLWTLDFHTRAGRTAIQRFTRENAAVRQALRESVSHNRHTEAAYLAAFYTDAACCTLSMDWSLRAEIEQFGMEADFAHAGVSPEHVCSLLAVFNGNVDHLNDVRENVLIQYLEGI